MTLQLFSFSPGSTEEERLALLLFSQKTEPEAMSEPEPDGAAKKPVAEMMSKKTTSKVKPAEELARARDEDGKFIADNPATDVNEAWVEKREN